MSILKQLDAMEAVILDDGEADPAELERICAQLRADPSQIPADQASPLVAQLHRLSEWAADRRDELEGALAALGEGRRALRGYSHLQSARTAQRLFRQA
jgi:hypothetical protein